VAKTVKPITAGPTPKPVPVRDVRTYDYQISFAKSKTTLAGRSGTYTWSSISFSSDLARVTWSANASTTASCKIAWRVSPDDFSYTDPFGATTNLSKGKSASGSKLIEVEESSGSLVVTSTCPRWTLSGVSYAHPAGWNPWGFNFVPGKFIYDPPAEFCGYFDCIPAFGNSAGYVVQCVDTTFSTAGGRSGACSWHGGVRRPLYRH
jgi:hypothetical protein